MLECPSGFTELPGFPQPGVVMCRPNGFVPGTYNAADCDAVASSGVDLLSPEVQELLDGYPPGFEFVSSTDNPATGITTSPVLCMVGGFLRIGESCPTGTVEATVSFAFADIPDAQGCFYVLLVRKAQAMDEAVASRCIEDTFEEPAAHDLAIGNQFRGEDGVLYSISKCNLNCFDGFDANCDGKLGDFCPVEGRGTVAGAKACIEARELGESAASVEPIAVPVSAGTPAAMKSVPAKVTAVGETSTLAHTGSEASVFAFFGVGLLGFGALAQGIRRKL